MELAGKVALVTGAGSGIGKAAALRFAAEGAAVGVLSQTEEEVEQTASEIEGGGGIALRLVADVSNDSALKTASRLSSVGRVVWTLSLATPASTACGHPSTRSSLLSGTRPSQ